MLHPSCYKKENTLLITDENHAVFVTQVEFVSEL